MSRKRQCHELYIDVEKTINNKDSKDIVLESYNNKFQNPDLKVYDFKVFKDRNTNIERSNKWMLKVTRRYHNPIRNIENFYSNLKLNGNFIVFIDQIVDPQNFGSIIKSCIYFGVDHLIVNKNNKIPLSPALAYVSNGGSESMSIQSVDDLVGFFNKGKMLNYRILTTFLNDDSNSNFEQNNNRKKSEYEKSEKNKNMSKNINTLELHENDNVILVLGSEDIGITELVKKYSTDNIKIESFSNSLDLLDSLNVATSAGILIDCISTKLKKI